MTRAYYNEHDHEAASWLAELIRKGHIADGIVDDTDIQKIVGRNLDEFTQVHLFAGIGGWSAGERVASVELVDVVDGK